MVRWPRYCRLALPRAESLRLRLITRYAIPAIGIANSRNSKAPDPPSGEKPKMRSMKSMAAPSSDGHFPATAIVSARAQEAQPRVEHEISDHRVGQTVAEVDPRS